MRPTVTRLAQAHEVVKPMRVRHATAFNVMHRGHLSRVAELAHAVATLEHLTPPLRVHSVPALTLPAHLPHSSSSSIAAFNTSKSTRTISATSRIDSDVPPARSQDTNMLTNSGGHAARD